MRNGLVIGASGLAAMLIGSSPAAAELHYVTRIEAHRPQATKPADANTPKMADALVRALLPEGPAETTYLIGENTMRAEVLKRTGVMPAGTILIRQIDGS